jgi:F-type H+-transporting ATPase subunit delta
MNLIAARYAKALYAKFDEVSATKVMRDMETLREWCKDHEEFLGFLQNPLIAREDAIKVIDKLSRAAHFNPLTKDFLILVARNRRLALLPQIIDRMMTLHDHAKGIIRAVITSAQKLGLPQLKNIQNMLIAKLKRTPKTIEIIDPQVLGGFKIRIGPYLIDATLKTQLMKIQTLLRGA